MRWNNRCFDFTQNDLIVCELIWFEADQVISNVETGFAFGGGCDLFEKVGDGDLEAGFRKFASF